jgi:hypothetical protein
MLHDGPLSPVALPCASRRGREMVEIIPVVLVVVLWALMVLLVPTKNL